MNSCRSCGSRNAKDLGFIGEVAPFFLKRVFNAEIRTSRARHPLRLLARRLCTFPHRLLSKVYGCSVCVEMEVCTNCSFIQTKHPFSEDSLARLYTDYRSAAYNEERIRYEPTYASIAKDVGFGEKELQTRVSGLTAWLSDKISCEDDFSMLDFGGADGRFLPRLEGKKFVFEISDVSPSEGIVRIAKEADLGTYSYVQIAHVLEHVPEPLALLKRVSSFVRPSGYLYIEVPQDLNDTEIADLKRGSISRGLPIHEHINVFCPSSVSRLVQAAGLEPVSIESAAVDIGWIAATIVRALCRKCD